MPLKNTHHAKSIAPKVQPLNSLNQAHTLAQEAFDPAVFRQHAALATARLERHLADHSIRGLALKEPAQLTQAARALMTPEHEQIASSDATRLEAIIDLYVETGIQVHSPGYMGRQFSGVVPLCGVMDLVSSIVNQPSSFYEAAQLPSVVERIMAEEFNRFIGWPDEQFTMITTSGGSLANLTAILAARNHKYPEFWKRGNAALPAGQLPAIAVGADVHYSVTRAAGILGIGSAQVLRLPLNEEQQICASQAEILLLQAESLGLQVFCMVVSSGTTATGAFDPIDVLADLARAHGAWLHVDGAHGASLLVSDKLRGKLHGIAKADSLTWDAHKMLFVPSPCTLLFYKDKHTSRGAFQQQASYVFENDQDIYTAMDSAESNFECTKRPMIMNLWVLWAVYGRALFAQKIEYLCNLTTIAWQMVGNQTDFCALHRPESNIFCFRYQPDNVHEYHLPDFQLEIRNRLKEQGRFFISKVEINGISALRIVLMNHQITPQHLQLLLDEIRQVGQDLLGQRLNRHSL
jgi:L-2,4-diaminobutyrate decarboxylase